MHMEDLNLFYDWNHNNYEYEVWLLVATKWYVKSSDNVTRSDMHVGLLPRKTKMQ